jgi:putative inorganic carbon (hco3(-)) transporter
MAISRRRVGVLGLTNVLAMLILLGTGLGLSRLLVSPRFGVTLVLVALLSTVPFALVLIVRPRFGVYLLFILSMVIISIKRLAWEMEVGLAIEFLEGVLVVGMASSILMRRDMRRLNTPLTPVVLAYVLYNVLLSLHPNLSSTIQLLYALREPVNYAVPFFAAVYLITDRRQVQQFIYLWLGTAVAIALYGLKQNYLGLNNWEIAWLSVSPTHLLYNRLRIFSTLGSADALGMHMAVSIVMALGFAFYTRDRRMRLLALAMVPLFVLTTLFTLTRGAYLGVVVGVLTLALLTRNRQLLLALLLAGFVAFGWYQANQGSLLANRVMTMFSPDQDESFNVRQDYMQEYMPLVFANPFGIGPATTGRQGWVLLEWSGIDPTLIASLAGVPTDSYYFRIALENGWVGFLLFAGLLIVVGVFGIRSYLRARDPLLKGLAASLVAGYAAMAVSSVSNNYFSHTELKLFFWFTMGILSNLDRIEREADLRAVRESLSKNPVKLLVGAHP